VSDPQKPGTHCPNCKRSTLSTVEVGWKKHRVIGESPRGYQFSVLTIKVPTVVVECSKCDFEQHGYVYEGTVHLEEDEVSV
jgi:hypothetical protein